MDQGTRRRLIVLALALLAPISHAQTFTCTFTTVTGCGFIEQSKVPGRATIVPFGRDGNTALRLHTEVGDDHVVFSSSAERDDVYLAEPESAGAVIYGEGVEQWWTHSIYFPDDFQYPSWHPYVVFDFHNTGDSATASMQMDFVRDPAGDSLPGRLEVRISSGNPSTPTYNTGIYGVVQKNVWYDFIHHVRWSSGPDGYFQSWVNGRQIFDYHGATLFVGQGVYLKLANYHLPICDPYSAGGVPLCTWFASSVIHDRVLMGPTPESIGLPKVRPPANLELTAP